MKIPEDGTPVPKQLWVISRFVFLRFVNVKVKVKFSLEQATKAQRVNRGIALLFL
jgi:hypothetical protein